MNPCIHAGEKQHAKLTCAAAHDYAVQQRYVRYTQAGYQEIRLILGAEEVHWTSDIARLSLLHRGVDIPSSTERLAACTQSSQLIIQ